MRSLQPEFFIISASLNSDADYCNYTRHRDLQYDLQYSDLPYKEVYGRYEGNEERAFLVVTNDLEGIIELAYEYDQQSVLHVSPMREAALIFLYDQAPQYLGAFVEVSKKLVGVLPNSTYDPLMDKLYTTRKIS